MGWALGCWEWTIWEGDVGKPRLGALFNKMFFVWDGTTTSKLGCHKLVDYIVMIHLSTYM